MIELKGTEKQIKLAENIRKDMIKKVDLMKKDANRFSSTNKEFINENEESFQELIDSLDIVEEIILKETSSVNFIKHKDNILGVFLEYNYKKYGDNNYEAKRDKVMNKSYRLIKIFEARKLI